MMRGYHDELRLRMDLIRVSTAWGGSTVVFQAFKHHSRLIQSSVSQAIPGDFGTAGAV